MWTIDDVDITFNQFEELLGRYGISIGNGSRLQEALAFPWHVQHVRRGSADIGKHVDRSQWREMVGIYDLAKRILAAERFDRNKFVWLSPWLRRFASLRGQLAQVADTSESDKDSDIVFELLVALCLLPVIEQLTPDTERGGNPDLLFTYRSQKWGIACKRLNTGGGPIQYRRSVRKAISQIEESEAEVGYVLVSLTKIIDHELFYPLNSDDTRLVLHPVNLRQMLKAEEKRLEDDIIGLADRKLTRELVAEFRGRKVWPGVINFVGTVALVGVPEAFAVTTVQHVFEIGRHHEFLYLLQDGLNSTSSDYRPANTP